MKGPCDYPEIEVRIRYIEGSYFAALTLQDPFDFVKPRFWTLALGFRV